MTRIPPDPARERLFSDHLHSRRERFNLLAWFHQEVADHGGGPADAAFIAHITYDPAVTSATCDYARIEEMGHDGTFAHTYDLLLRVLRPLVRVESFSIPRPPDPSRRCVDARYRIGDARLATAFSPVRLACRPERPYHGQRDRVTLPVCVRYVYEDDPDVERPPLVLPPARHRERPAQFVYTPETVRSDAPLADAPQYVGTLWMRECRGV
jgi:hypothetical protein